MAITQQTEADDAQARTDDVDAVGEVKFNASGYSTYLNLLDEDDPLHQKISDHGMMEPVPLTKVDLQRLVAVGMNVRTRNVHFHNTKARIKRVAHQTGAVPQ